MDRVEVVNLGLIKLGDPELLTSLTTTKKGLMAAAIYDAVRRAELRSHPWNFAKERVALSADPDAPAHGFNYRYTLPEDYIRLHPDVEAEDWQIENGFILTDDSAPLNVIYIYDHDDETAWDALFVQAMAIRIAIEMCMYVTNSNTKKTDLKTEYSDAVAEARRTNAIENVAAEGPEDIWISARQ